MGRRDAGGGRDAEDFRTACFYLILSPA
jgi:hypothetical protein